MEGLPDYNCVAFFPERCKMTSSIATVSAQAVIDRLDRLCRPRAYGIEGNVPWATQTTQEETDQHFQCMKTFSHPDMVRWYKWWASREADYLRSKLHAHEAHLRPICKRANITIKTSKGVPSYHVPWSVASNYYHREPIDELIGRALSPFSCIRNARDILHHRYPKLDISQGTIAAIQAHCMMLYARYLERLCRQGGVEIPEGVNAPPLPDQNEL